MMLENMKVWKGK